MSPSASHLRAVLYAVAGFTLWVTGDMFLKLIGETAVPKYEMMAVSSVGGMTVIFAYTVLRSDISKLRPRNRGGLLVLGLLHLMNFSCWIMALSHLPLTTLYTITFLSPILVAILAALFLREHFSWKHGLAIVAGFVGVSIAVNPEHLFQDSGAWVNYAYVFACTLIMSVQMLILRILGPKENRESTAFYPRIIILIGSVAAGVIMGFGPMSMKSALLCLLSGGVGGIGWLFMAQAYKLAPAAQVAPFHYSEIVTGALAGYVIWRDVPSMHVIIGAAIIIASGIYIITHTRRSAQVLREESHD